MKSLQDIETPSILPPVVIFAYNRPQLLKKILDSIKTQSLQPQKIIAYIDNSPNEEGKIKVNECIELLKNSTHICIDINLREHNYGCNRNIMSGITEVLSKYESAVFIEDDVLFSSHLYETMVKLLQVYESHENIFSIGSFPYWSQSSYFNQLMQKLMRKISTDVFFMNRFNCWGWATWSKKWKSLLSEDLTVSYKPIKVPNCPLIFDLNYLRFLTRNKQSWDIAISVACVEKNYLHIAPSEHMVKNIGFGENATNTKGKSNIFNSMYKKDFKPNTLPNNSEIDPVFKKPLSLIDLFLIYSELTFNRLARNFLTSYVESEDTLSIDLNNVLLPAKLPPIILFVFNRPKLLKRCLESIAKQSIYPSKIIAYVDGPKKKFHQNQINECIQILKEFQNIPVEITMRTTHHGCRKNISYGISEVFTQYESAVIIEDDILFSPYLYETMAKSLIVYKNNDNVFSICSFPYFSRSGHFTSIMGIFLKKVSTDLFFINRFNSWGWATWAHKWAKIAPVIEADSHRNFYKKFYDVPKYPLSFDLVYLYYLLKSHDSWAVPVALTCLKLNYLHLAPCKQMVQNIGFGADATHTKNACDEFNSLYCENFKPNTAPKNTEIAPELDTPLSLFDLSIIFTELICKKMVRKLKSTYF